MKPCETSPRQSADNPLIPTKTVLAMIEAKVGRRGRVTLWRWTRDGKFPRRVAEWPGKPWVWRRIDVQMWLDSLTTGKR